MNAEQYTKKTVEALNTAQGMAAENQNAYVTPEHLLYALVDDDGGLTGTLLGRMGVGCDGVLAELDGIIEKLAKVSGGGDIYASRETAEVLTLAEKTAANLKDSYVSVEHLMLALLAKPTAELRRLFQDQKKKKFFL